MTKYTERLMSRASVAAMAAFAKEPASTVPAFAERIDADAGGGDREPAPIDGLTAEEQAQVDAMNTGQAADGGNVDDRAGPAEGDAGAGADGDGEDDGDGGALADGDAAGAADRAADGQPRQAPKTISYGRHQKELAKAESARVAMQAELDTARGETTKEREQRLRLDERTKVLLEAISGKGAPAAAAPKEPDDPEPDGEEDPIAHSAWQGRELKRTQKIISDMQSGQNRREQATAAESADRQIYDTLVTDIQRAAASDPTMQDAFVHLRETRFRELGYIYAHIDITDPAECATLSQADQAKLAENIQRQFHTEQMIVARQAIEGGKSPAATVRNLARARGWTPKAAEPDAAAAPAAAPAARNGAAPPARNGNGAAPPAAAPSVKDQLSAVRDNLDASRSLSDAGGSPGGQMTPQRIADMSPAEFEAYYNSIPKDQFDRMMGKPADM